LTVQVSGFVVIEAVNACVEPARTFAVLGEMVRVSPTGGPGAVYPAGVSAQLEFISTKAKIAGASIDERRTEPPRVFLETGIESTSGESAELERASLATCELTRRPERRRLTSGIAGVKLAKGRV
jgi:hypothetical protein